MFPMVLWITFSLKTCYFSNNHKMAVYIFIVKFFFYNYAAEGTGCIIVSATSKWNKWNSFLTWKESSFKILCIHICTHQFPTCWRLHTLIHFSPNHVSSEKLNTFWSPSMWTDASWIVDSPSAFMSIYEDKREK